jgi:hypothetical protein
MSCVLGDSVTSAESKSTMKMKHVSIMAAVAVISLGVNPARAVQKHDPMFQSAHTTIPQASDPDLVHQLRHLPGSPHNKPDLYAAHLVGPSADRDLVREIRYQNGTPRSKVDPAVQR